MKKKRTKRSQQRLNNLLIILVLTAVLMVMSTYAWFTANRTVTLEALSVRATTTNGLQISSGTSAWSNSMTGTDLVNASTVNSTIGVTNMLAYYFNNVSSALGSPTVLKTGSSDYGLDFFLGTATQSTTEKLSDGSNAYVLTASKIDEINTNLYSGKDTYDSDAPMMAFDFFLKFSGTKDVEGLWSNVTVTSTTTSKDIQNAVRVAFVVGDAVTTDKDGNACDVDTTFVPSVSSPDADFSGVHTGSGSTVVSFEPFYKTHSTTAITNDRLLGLTSCPDNGTSQTTYGLTSAIASGSEQKLVDLFKAEISGVSSKVTYTTQSENGTGYMTIFDNKATPKKCMQPGVTKVRCYIWVEGQDYDCQNGATGGDFSVNFDFTLDDPRP